MMFVFPKASQIVVFQTDGTIHILRNTLSEESVRKCHIICAVTQRRISSYKQSLSLFIKPPKKEYRSTALYNSNFFFVCQFTILESLTGFWQQRWVSFLFLCSYRSCSGCYLLAFHVWIWIIYIYPHKSTLIAMYMCLHEAMSWCSQVLVV